MKRTIIAPNTEPTLYDVLEAVNSGFSRVENRLGKVEYEVTEIKTELNQLNTRVGRLEVKVDIIDERLESLEIAFDRDAITIVDHENRITKLETVTIR
ncbi:MAG: hypothetical protein ABIT47_01060 [Candidatus Paceibacterota bacterium]